MTVAELIAALSKLPQDRKVILYVEYKDSFGQAYDFAESVGVSPMEGCDDVVRIANMKEEG